MHLRQQQLISDLSDLYSPKNAPSTRDLARLEEMNFGLQGTPPSEKDIFRMTSIAITAKRGTDPNIFTHVAVSAIQGLNEHIAHMTVVDNNGREFTFRDICSTDSVGNCKRSNDAVNALEAPDNQNASVRVTYPMMHKNPFVPGVYLGNVMGRVSLAQDNVSLTGFEAFVVLYQGDSRKEDSQRLWERQAVEYIISFNDSNTANLSVEYRLSTSAEDAYAETESEAAPRFVATIAFIVVLSVVSQVRLRRSGENWKKFELDWDKTHCGLGLLGTVCAMLGIGSASGLLLYAGMPTDNMVSVMPFLVLGESCKHLSLF